MVMMMLKMMMMMMMMTILMMMMMMLMLMMQGLLSDGKTLWLRNVNFHNSGKYRLEICLTIIIIILMTMISILIISMTIITILIIFMKVHFFPAVRWLRTRLS